MKAVILAGGMGTRLSEYTKEIPKPMIPIKGKPVLEYQIDNFKRYGITDIIIVVGYLANKIKEFFGDGTNFGVNIEYFDESKPLGTAGALYYIKELLSEEFILAYGDVIFDLDLDRFINFHREKGGIGTLAAHPNNHPFDSDILKLGEEGSVEEIIKKNENRNFFYKNCVNAGIFVFNRLIIEYVLENKKQDLEKDIIARLIKEKKIYAYITTEYMKDMGTPARYELVEKHMEEGIVKSKNLSNKQRAIFLDRDGTINKYVGLVSKPEQLELETNVVEALKMINDSSYISIIITNQPVVARNLCSISELNEIHKKLETVFGEQGVYVDDIYYCPHHPDKGYPEENKQYKIQCKCRKPDIGLMQRAAEKYNIDFLNSYFIGDTTVDVQTGKNAGLKTILLATGKRGLDNKFQVKPDFYAEDLLQAVKIILKKNHRRY